MRVRKHGFTLVELLVVISIITILAGMLLPALQKAVNTARGIACLNQTKQVGVIFEMYRGDFNDLLPLEDRYHYDTLKPDSTKQDNFHWWSDFQLDAGLVEDKQVLVCPYYAPKKWDDTGKTYGIRVEAGPTIPSKYSGNDSHSYLITRRVNRPSRLLILADSCHGNYKRQSMEYRRYTKNHANQGTVHLRHINQVNSLFLDGHSESLLDGELLNFGIRSYRDQDDKKHHF